MRSRVFNETLMFSEGPANDDRHVPGHVSRRGDGDYGAVVG
jgi:hypothetical protein